MFLSIGTNTIIRSPGECTIHKLQRKLLEEDQCVVNMISQSGDANAEGLDSVDQDMYIRLRCSIDLLAYI